MAVTNFKTVLRVQTQSQQRYDSLSDLYLFIKKVLANPNTLLNSNIRAKNKAVKYGKIFECIKLFSTLDPHIVLGKFKDMRPFIKFEKINFVRSFEYIHCFKNSTVAEKTLCAVIVGRKLQVYEYMSGKMLFEINLPNASSYQKGKNIQFLDNDNVIMVQDAQYRLTFINVQAQIEAYGKKNLNNETKDITFKIEGPIVIDNNFGLENDMLEKAEKNSDESEITSESNMCKQVVEFEYSID